VVTATSSVEGYGVARTARAGGQDSDRCLSHRRLFGHDARPVRALQTLTHLADRSVSGHIAGRPTTGSDQVSESLTATYQAHGNSRWILTAHNARS